MVNQPNLHAERYGELKQNVLPVIVLHGWNNSIEHIKPLSLRLADYTQVHALDLPGHGQSEVPAEVWGMQEVAQTVKEYLDKNNISRAHFVGHSFGGKTSIKFAALYPERVEKIVLIGSSGIRPPKTLRKKLRNYYLTLLRSLIRFKNSKLGEKIYQEWYIPRYASRDYKAAGRMRNIFVKTVNEELHQELSSIKQPCLLLWGEHDDESPPIVGEIMKQHLKDAQLIVLPGQDHFPHLGAAAPLVVKYIRDFLFVSA